MLESDNINHRFVNYSHNKQFQNLFYIHNDSKCNMKCNNLVKCTCMWYQWSRTHIVKICQYLRHQQGINLHHHRVANPVHHKLSKALIVIVLLIQAIINRAKLCHTPIFDPRYHLISFTYASLHH